MLKLIIATASSVVFLFHLCAQKVLFSTNAFQNNFKIQKNDNYCAIIHKSFFIKFNLCTLHPVWQTTLIYFLTYIYLLVEWRLINVSLKIQNYWAVWRHNFWLCILSLLSLGIVHHFFKKVISQWDFVFCFFDSFFNNLEFIKISG